MKVIIPPQAIVFANCWFSFTKSVQPPVEIDCAGCYTYAHGRKLLRD